MKLVPPGDAYNRITEVERNRQLEQADKRNHKKGRDVEIGSGRLIISSPNGSRFRVTVADDGTLSAIAI